VKWTWLPYLPLALLIFYLVRIRKNLSMIGLDMSSWSCILDILRIEKRCDKYVRNCGKDMKSPVARMWKRCKIDVNRCITNVKRMSLGCRKMWKVYSEDLFGCTHPIYFWSKEMQCHRYDVKGTTCASDILPCKNQENFEVGLDFICVISASCA